MDFAFSLFCLGRYVLGGLSQKWEVLQGILGTLVELVRWQTSLCGIGWESRIVGWGFCKKAELSRFSWGINTLISSGRWFSFSTEKTSSFCLSIKIAGQEWVQRKQLIQPFHKWTFIYAPWSTLIHTHVFL